MVECGHLGPQKNKHNMPHQLIPLTQVIPMQAFLNNFWEIMQLAPLQAIWKFGPVYSKSVTSGCYDLNIPPTYRGRPVGLQMSTPCDGCGILYCWTPHTQLGRVFRCFPFFVMTQIFSDILQTSDSAQWPQRFFIIGQLAPNSAECSDVFLS